MTNEPIYIVEHESYVELRGLTTETDVDERITTSISADPRLMHYIVQRIAHNRAEQRLAESGPDSACAQRIGDILAHELIEVAELVQSKIPTVRD